MLRCLCVVLCVPLCAEVMELPKLTTPVIVDGDLKEWKEHAFHDGVWDIYRVRHMPWFEPKINRLTRHGNEASPAEDLAARYYTAWDDRYLYLGAEVIDNVNDVDDPAHEPKRWYFKDAICWFVEVPRDRVNERFGEGDHAFCFVADARRPDYAAWHRWGDKTRNYIEEPLKAVEWTLKRGANGNFVLEAKVDLVKATGGAPKVGDEWGLEIVHTDPDGGGYGGHIILCGKGDDDNTWGHARLVGSQPEVERKPE